MKKIMMLGMLFGWMALGSAAGEVPTVSLQEVKEGELTNFSRGKIILKIDEGANIPVGFFLDGDLISFLDEKIEEQKLVAKQTFYIWLDDGKDFLFSQDLENWLSFLEFFTGEAKVFLDIEEGDPILKIGSILNRRIES